MALTDSFPSEDVLGLSITDTRRVIAGLVARNADGTARVGVFPASMDPIVTGRASMAYDVASFLAATARVAGGVELVANDALTVVATTAAPGSNSRIDVIWVRPQFEQHADPGNVPVLGVTQGTAAAVPSKPVIPAGALELATAEILSTTTTTSTAVISQTHPYTAAAGGIVLVRNSTELDTYIAAEGTTARDLATRTTYVRGESGWDGTSIRIGMRRTTQTGTISNSTYTDLSASTFWNESFRESFPAYAGSIAVPLSGVYRISYSVACAQGVLTGITVNKAASIALSDLECADSAGPVQGIAVAGKSALLELNSGDVLRLFAIASAAGGTWRTEPGLSLFQVEFVRP